jgi:hypothetical protein
MDERGVTALMGYEARRAGWPAQSAVPVVVGVGMVVTVLLVAKGNSGTVAFEQFWLREMVPLAFGVAVAAVPGAERCTELQLSVPHRYTATLAHRAVLCTVASSCCAVLFALLIRADNLVQAVHGALAGQLMWISPAVALIGVAAIAFAVSGNTAAGAAAVAGVWLVQELTVQWFTDHTWSRPLYLFLDDTADVPDRWWWTNRLGLLVVGFVLIAAAGAVINHQQERIFAARLRNPNEES